MTYKAIQPTAIDIMPDLSLHKDPNRNTIIASLPEHLTRLFPPKLHDALRTGLKNGWKTKEPELPFNINPTERLMWAYATQEADIFAKIIDTWVTIHGQLSGITWCEIAQLLTLLAETMETRPIGDQIDPYLSKRITAIRPAA